MKLRLHSLDSQVQSGFILPAIIGIIVAMGIITAAVALSISANVSLGMNNERSQRALNAAEAGVNYYLWHLSHSTGDYKDGQTTPATPDPLLGYGPYTHDYLDTNANKVGTFTLWINPQGSGSTIVKVRSIGTATGSSAQRIIDAKIGAPSYASYGVVADGPLWFGNTESASGPIHSNQGIRLDGDSSSDATSANATYTPPGSLGGDGSAHPGVWCSTSVTTPVNCNTRSKVDWRFPVPSIDFNQVAGDLCKMKKAAFAAESSTASLATQANACTQTPTTRTPSYLPQRSTTGSYSLTKGYLITLNSNSTYDLSQVNAENDTLTPYSSALTLTSVATNIAIPTTGVIFAEDNVWVRTASTFDGRLTIGVGRLASSSVYANVSIADDIMYHDKDGTDAIGLVAEGSVIMKPYAPPSTGNFTFEVDAAVIAQTGDVRYPQDYDSNTNKCARGWTGANQKLNFYGSVSTRQVWTWTVQYGSSCADNVYDSTSGNYFSGILNNTTQYDYNLQYAPPPYFPITSTYNILEWREVVKNP